MNKQIILVTGAGTGIGKLSARSLAEAGHIVYASMRDIAGRNAPRAAELRALAAAEGLELHPLELDVLSQDSADAAAATIVREQGQLDVVIQNAGHLVVGPTEAFTPEEIVKVFDTNVLGAQRVNRAVLPYLRRQESGLMLWISSTTTRGGFPPFMAFNKNGLQMMFACSKDPSNLSITTIEASFTNAQQMPMDGLNFQVAVPKYMKLQMTPASGTTVPPMGSGKVTQVFKVANSLHGQKPVLLRIKIDYTMGGVPVGETGQVDSFPAGI